MIEDKLKNYLFKKPENWVHLREIARALKISPESVRNAIKKPSLKKMIQEKKEGNLVMIRANIEFDGYKNEKMLDNLKSIHNSGIIEYLNTYYNPKTIILFGSYRYGEDLSTSDIDLGIITNKKEHVNLIKYEKKLSRKINLSLFIKKDVSDEFWNNIINGIVLAGVLKNE